MKHAILILAHDNIKILKTLLSHIDDECVDVFLHIDKKANFDGIGLHLQKGRLIILDKRIDAAWGDYSLVKIELELIKKALSVGDYEYLHLISGVDMPINPLDTIYLECEQHRGKEFIGYAQNVNSHELRWRTQHYFLFSRQFRSKSIFKRTLRYAYAKLQSTLGYKRSPLEIKKGSQWWSITSDFARYVVSNEAAIRKYFSRTYCPDEMVFQTLCWNSPFKDNIYRTDDEFKGCRRYIPWVNGELKRFTNEDFEKMQASDYWFARKFDEDGIERYKKHK